MRGNESLHTAACFCGILGKRRPHELLRKYSLKCMVRCVTIVIMDSKGKYFIPCSREPEKRVYGDAKRAEARLYGQEMGWTIKCHIKCYINTRG